MTEQNERNYMQQKWTPDISIVERLERIKAFMLQTKAMFRIGFPEYTTEYDGVIDTLSEAVALLEAQKPRLMTLDEVIANQLNPLWLETLDGYYRDWILWRAYDDEGRILFFWGDSDESWTIQTPPDDYGKAWRCWSAPPTEPQRSATPWE